MSINDHNDEEIVRLPGFWSTAAKMAIAMSVPATFAVISLLAWVVTKTFEHDTRLAVIESRITSVRAAQTAQAVAKVQQPKNNLDRDP